MKELRVGQYWLDKINRDILKIREFDRDMSATETVKFEERPVYARCACYVHGHFFGIQEMRTSHFATDRFEPLSKWAAYWILGKARLKALRIWRQG